MAVFRVERNKGYTVMSNHHLRNKELTLKAKGLLSQMLSLPEDWDYTLAGLSQINREKIDAIREEKRNAVLLYYFEGMTDNDIAKLLNISRSTVQYRRTSSFELLKRYLEERAYDDEEI